MNALAAQITPHGPADGAAGRTHSAEESRRGCAYPISRWYVRPLAGCVARALAPTFVRPDHLTLGGLASATAAGTLLVLRPEAAPLAAGLVLLAWFFDRADGQLARLQATASAWGAWLDANIDELTDLGLHAAVACAAASLAGSAVPWWLLAGFLGGKYLFMYGLNTEGRAPRARSAATPPQGLYPTPFAPRVAFVRRLWHLPGNADVRMHLLILALLTGCLSAELAVVAGYYNLRWMARYVLVARRLRGGAA